MDQNEVRATLKSLFPPGDEELYAWDNPEAYVSRELEAVTTAVRVKGTSAIERVRQEFRPQASTEKAADWERIFGLSQSRTSGYGTLEARRAQIVARWRESGASTLPHIQAALAAVLGYPPQILEHSRSQMTAQHTYPFPNTPLLVPPFATARASVRIADNAPVSKGGARLTLVATVPPRRTLRLSLFGPAGASASWVTSAALSAGPRTLVFYGRDFVGTDSDGLWTVTVFNPSATPARIESGSLFVEGIGRARSGAEGLGANIFEWTVLVDPARLGPNADLDFARQLVARWNPAHCRGYLSLMSSSGSPYAVFDDPNTRFDASTWAP